MAECLISIGSNIGDRSYVIESALAELREHPALQLHSTSNYHITQPVGGPPGQSEFVNAAALVETSLPPTEVLSLLHAVELRAGRKRGVRWGARSLDLDLLLYGDVVIDDEQIILPHPRLAFRRFVLAPAAEVAPKMLHPVLGRSIEQLLQHLERAPNYVAITGLPGVGKADLVSALSKRVSAKPILGEQGGDSCSPDDASPSQALELELLNARCALLRNISFSSASYSISDFWLGQSLAYAKELLPIGYRQFEEAWAACHSQVISPKLVVLIETSISEETRGERAGRLLAVQHNLQQQLVETDGTPTLRLNATAPSWNEEEVAAAILAM
ncbi:MAG: 2-amino-4-hydroxy-6-hydroxymethyldihydropteridine diphosphokinase [Planctomycetes bacterium]|nr:2-amino-4-hydroxy-6-hydroxymethyldihydropteridine diphosphokinase [Planctomycetota bacterium]